MEELTQFTQMMNGYEREVNKSLKRLFSGKIKGTFLIEIKRRVFSALGSEISNFYDVNPTSEKLISAETDSINYDVCRHIVGVHRSHLVFKTEDERLEMERSEEYKRRLTEEVITQIRLRAFGGVYFRRHALMKGENFIYFPLPYDLFVLCTRMSATLNKSDRSDALYHYFCAICNKGLSALTLLEDNLFECAYPICRSVIETDLKAYVIHLKPEVESAVKRFDKFDYERTQLAQDYPQEFIELYNNRSNRNCTKVDYLHYGWLDSVNDYHLDGMRPYSIGGIISYIKAKDGITDAGDDSALDCLERMYKQCHGYAHANTVGHRYPLMNYFEISTMLYITLAHAYKLTCRRLRVVKEINGIDIIDKVERDFSEMWRQYRRHSYEKLEEYYKLNKI